jgi:VanZ family protein
MSDKVIHGIMYVFLAVAWMVPVSRKHPLSVLGYSSVCLAVTAFGGLMEILQRFCTLTRSGEMADLYADFLGALVGVLIIGIWRICTTSR